MSLYYLIVWNQVDILQKHFKKDHVHMRLWTKFYGIRAVIDRPYMWQQGRQKGFFATCRMPTYQQSSKVVGHKIVP